MDLIYQCLKKTKALNSIQNKFNTLIHEFMTE